MKTIASILLASAISITFTALVLAKQNDIHVNGDQITKSLTIDQDDLLTFAYHVAKSDGIKDPKLVQGVIMQESKAGTVNDFRVAGVNPNDRYYGIGQIKFNTAKGVMKRFPELWNYLDTKTDEELKARLIVDDYFNVRVMSKYLLLLGINKDPMTAVTSYNVGPGAAKQLDAHQHPYALSVKSYADRLKNIFSEPSKIQSSKLKLVALDNLNPREP